MNVIVGGGSGLTLPPFCFLAQTHGGMVNAIEAIVRSS
jgi:hypothetical protein